MNKEFLPQTLSNQSLSHKHSGYFRILLAFKNGLAILFFSGLLGKTQIYSQTNSDKSILSFLNDAEYYINQTERDKYIIDKLEFDLVYNSEVKTTPIFLYKNQNYKILLLGETEKVLYIGLKILSKPDNSWNTVKDEVNNPSNLLSTSFTPSFSGYYEFEITVSKFSSGYTSGRYCLIVSYE